MPNTQNGKVILKVVPVHVMKAHGEAGVEHLSILVLDGSVWLVSRSRRFVPVGKETTVTTERDVCGPQGRSGCWRDNLFPLLGIEPRLPQPVSPQLSRRSYAGL